jgi:hypothetical protein
MRRAGVKPGDVLFVGTERPNGPVAALEGEANIFRAKCGSIPYHVVGMAGPLDGKDRIDLMGDVPLVTRDCQVTGITLTSASNHLIFFLRGKFLE